MHYFDRTFLSAGERVKWGVEKLWPSSKVHYLRPALGRAEANKISATKKKEEK